MPFPCRQPGLRHRRQDPDQETRIDSELPAAAKFPGNQQGLIISALTQTVRVEGDRNDEVGNPVRGDALPGRFEKTGKGAIEGNAAIKLEAMNSVAQRLFIKAGGDSPGKIRRSQQAFSADMIAAADGGKGESAARTTGRGDGKTAAQTTGAEGGIR